MVRAGKEGMDGEELCDPGDCSGGLKGGDHMDGELLFLMESGDDRNNVRGPGGGNLPSELDKRVLEEFEFKHILGCKGDGVINCLSSKLKFTP